MKYNVGFWKIVGDIRIKEFIFWLLENEMIDIILSVGIFNF